MFRNTLFNNFTSIQKKVGYSIRNLSTKLDIAKLEQESSTSVTTINEETQLKEEHIERRRNKSRLREQDRNILMDKNPYPEPQMFHHGTLKYLRRTYGRYGQAANVDPSICWPIKEELEIAKEYEYVKYPFKIQDMIAEAAQKKKEKIERIQARQIEIGKKMLKLEEWKKDLHNRIAKKEAEAKSAKERKERLVEEVRRHFGYSVDPKDERFKEMLEKKEKEQRKTLKEEKRKQKEAKLLDRLSSKKKGETSDTTENKDKKDTNEEKELSTKEH